MPFHACDECGAVYLGVEEAGERTAVCRNCRVQLREATAAEAVAHLRAERWRRRPPRVDPEWLEAELEAEVEAEEGLVRFG